MKSEIRRINGVLKVVIDGRAYDPLSFKSFRPNKRNVSEFYSAGIRLFSVLSTGLTSALGVPYSLFGESWIGDRRYDFTPIDRQMELFISNAPDAYFAPMLQVDTRDWYLDLHPGVPNSFTHLSQIAADETWRRAAADYIKAAIEHLEARYGDRIYGYFLLGGTTTEWFSHWDMEASHPIKEQAYKAWCGDPRASLASLERLNMAGGAFLSHDEGDVYSTRKFHSELISDLVLYFAAEVQSVIKHEKLLGVYYGYLFELGGERLYNDGVLDYERVYLSEDIDMISSPSSYAYRGLYDPSAFMLTAATLDKHNKLYFLEFDHITHVAPEEIHDGLDENADNCRLVKIPGADSKCKDECESLNLMYRDFILCLGSRVAMWWFDMFDGWFRSEGMMRAVSRMIEIKRTLGLRSAESTADIAVIAEGESMYRARKSAGLATLTLSDIRRTLAECGCAYDIYSISDFGEIDLARYKLVLFINQYDIPDDRLRLIRERLSGSGKYAMWLYAPGYATDGEPSAEKISECVGMTVRESEMTHGEIVYKNERTDTRHLAPYFDITDEHREAIAEFEDGACAVASVMLEGYRSVYAACPNIPSSLLRDIAKQAGAFVYSESDKVYAYLNSAAIGVYNATDRDAVISVKEDGVYRDLIEGGEYVAKGGRLTLPLKSIRACLLKKGT